MTDSTWVDRIAGKPILVFAVFLTLVTWWAGDVDFRAWTVPGALPPVSNTGEREDWEILGNPQQAAFSGNGITLSAGHSDSLRVIRLLPYDPAAGEESLPLRISGQVLRHSDPTLELDRDKQTMFFIEYCRDETSLGYGAITRFTGQYSKRRFEYLVKPPAGTDTLALTWQVRGPGSWELQALKVSTVAVNAYYHVVAALLLAGWGALLVCFIWPLLHKAPIPLLAVTGIALGIVVLGTGLGQPAMQLITEPLIDSLWQTWLRDQVTIQGVMKAGHILAFAFLAMVLLVLRPHTQMSAVDTFALLVTLAIATEALQRHRYNRSGEWSDVAIDVVGILFGFLICRLTRHLKPQAKPLNAESA